MRSIVGTETSASVYESTLRKIPEKGKISRACRVIMEARYFKLQ